MIEATAAEQKSYTEGRDAEIGQGLRQLVVAAGTNSRDHGFHDDWPIEPYPMITETGEPALHVSAEEVEGHQSSVRRAIAEKLALVHEEISEALGEIRSGRDPLEIYFVDHKGLVGTKGLEYTEQQYDDQGIPLCKPEGFLVELVDAIIRIGDLGFLVGDLFGGKVAYAHRVKSEYNSTRPHKHGRKF